MGMTGSGRESPTFFLCGGLPAYFTVDAGPNVHIICEGKDEKE